MITAVDTNILLDLLIPGAPEGDCSERALTAASGAGATSAAPNSYFAARGAETPWASGSTW